jgi:FkbM family methyltransferase
MSYYDCLEKVVLHEKEWFKIIGDHAFPFVLDDWHSSYKEAYLKRLKDTSVVVQAGGFCGIYPRLFSEIFKMVYTFEPDPLNFFCLTMNCQNDNIIKNQAALGKVHQMISVHRSCGTNKGMNTVVKTQYSSIPSYKIDDLDLSKCDLIQLDTEGYEFNILQGALSCIDQHRPVIAVEDCNEKIVNLLQPYGYSVKEKVGRDTVLSV